MYFVLLWSFVSKPDFEARSRYLHVFLHLRLSEWTIFWIPNKNKLQIPVPHYPSSNYTQVNKRHWPRLGFNSYGTQFLCFWIILMLLRHFENALACLFCVLKNLLSFTVSATTQSCTNSGLTKRFSNHWKIFSLRFVHVEPEN